MAVNSKGSTTVSVGMYTPQLANQILDAAVSATNPSYTFSVLVSEWTPLNGGVGELATASVTWPISGAITKATS